MLLPEHLDRRFFGRLRKARLMPKIEPEKKNLYRANLPVAE
jgi:hypothetical protein